MDECAQNGLKETMKERKRERERDLVGPRGGNFDAVTGFMSFLPFGGFHFQSGLLELVIQTRPTNERTVVVVVVVVVVDFLSYVLVPFSS